MEPDNSGGPAAEKHPAPTQTSGVSRSLMIGLAVLTLGALGYFYFNRDTGTEIASVPATEQAPPAAGKDLASKDLASKDAASKDAASKDTASKDTASKDAASKDTASKDTASKDTASKDTASKDTASKDVAATSPASAPARPPAAPQQTVTPAPPPTPAAQTAPQAPLATAAPSAPVGLAPPPGADRPATPAQAQAPAQSPAAAQVQAPAQAQAPASSAPAEIAAQPRQPDPLRNQPASLPGDDVVYVQKPGVNIRAEPGKRGRVVGSAKKGDQFKVVGRTGSWVQVEGDGRKGWIGSRLLGPQSP